jgi:hypothetical protein
MPDSYDPTVVRGDTLRWTVSLTDSSGNTYNLNGATLSMFVGSRYDNNSYLVNYTIGITAGTPLTTPDGYTGGISATANGGVAFISLGSKYTSQIPVYTGAFYDIQLVKPSSRDVVTILRGKITVVPDVTEI